MQSFPNEILTGIRSLLEQQKAQVAVRILELTKQDPFSDPDRTIDNAASDTEANEESSHDRFAAMVAELTMQQASIDNALARISDGSYGYCMNCRTMIDTDRLGILPTATLCLSCEQKKDAHRHA